MPICKVCHRFVRKKNFKRHEAGCIASEEDIKRIAESKVAHEAGFKKRKRERKR